MSGADNYPDDMTNEDYKYINGERLVDVANEKWEDLSLEEQLQWFFFEGDDASMVERCGDVVEHLMKTVEGREVLIKAINEQVSIKGKHALAEDFKSSKEEWIDNWCESIRD